VIYTGAPDRAPALPPPALQSTIEKQVTSTNASPPKVSFGTSKRPPLCSPSVAPGPGAYKTKPAIGEAACLRA
jgi:hypothetical protein